MGKVKYGSGIAEIRGKVGGSIYSRNKGGAYVKNFASPTNPQTALQIAVRQKLNDVSRLWSTISGSQRNNWNEVAATIAFTDSLGEAYYLSGFGLFCKCNLNLESVNIASILEPYVDMSVPKAVDGFSTDPDVNGPAMPISSDDATVPVDHSYVVHATVQHSPNKVNMNNFFKHLTYYASAAVFDTADVAAAYEAKFGALQEDAAIQCRAKSIFNLSGMASAVVTDITKVVDTTI